MALERDESCAGWWPAGLFDANRRTPAAGRAAAGRGGHQHGECGMGRLHPRARAQRAWLPVCRVIDVRVQGESAVDMVSAALAHLDPPRRPRRGRADPRRRLEDRAGHVRPRGDRHRHRHVAAAGVHRARPRDRPQRRRRGRPQLAEDPDGVRGGAGRARRRLPVRGRAGVVGHRPTRRSCAA